MRDEATTGTVGLFGRLILGAKIEVIEDASHAHHLEQPERYLAMVRAFLAA